MGSSRLLKSLFIFIMLFPLMTQATPQMPPTLVNVAHPKAILWQQTLKETGSVVAEQGIIVKSEIEGRISKIFFQSGQTVQKGDPLVQLNPDVLNAQLQQNEAQLTLNQLAFNRDQGLLSKRVISQADYDQALSNYKSAQAQVAQTKAELDQLLINAPFDGKVGLQQVNLGDYVDAGDSIVNLQSIDPIYVDFSIPELYISKVHVNQVVKVTSAAYSKHVFTGKVVAMESLIDPNTRTLKIRAILPNPKGQLIPGAFVEVSLELSAPQQVLSIPQTALFNAPDGTNAIYTVKNNHAILTKIKIIKQRNDDVLIAPDITPETQVVVEGAMKLQDQAPVQIAH